MVTAATENLFDQLIVINERAFDARRFDAAFHALTAALYCAFDDHNSIGLTLVNRVACEQLNWIDLHDPDYHHSSVASAKRGFATNIFVALARQASLKADIIERRLR